MHFDVIEESMSAEKFINFLEKLRQDAGCPVFVIADELINWSRIESLLAGLHSSPRGEKAWPPLMMFKALLLQSWYALSDPALEKQLARDLLFRRFIGLSISESVSDHSTL